MMETTTLDGNGYSVYETESCVVIAVKIDFDLSKLRLFVNANEIKLIVDDEDYRKIDLPARINPKEVKTDKIDSRQGFDILRIELSKSENDDYLEVDFEES